MILFKSFLISKKISLDKRGKLVSNGSSFVLESSLYRNRTLSKFWIEISFVLDFSLSLFFPFIFPLSFYNIEFPKERERESVGGGEHYLDILQDRPLFSPDACKIQREFTNTYKTSFHRFGPFEPWRNTKRYFVRRNTNNPKFKGISPSRAISLPVFLLEYLEAYKAQFLYPVGETTGACANWIPWRN